MRCCGHSVAALAFCCAHVVAAVPQRPAQGTCSSGSTCAAAGEEAEALLQRKWQGRPEVKPELALAEVSHWPPKAVVSEDMDLMGMRGVPPAEDHEGWLPASEAFDNSGMVFGDSMEAAGGEDVFADLQREQARADQERSEFDYGAPDDSMLRTVNRAPEEGAPDGREAEDGSSEGVALEAGAPAEGMYGGSGQDDGKFYSQAPDGAEDGVVPAAGEELPAGAAEAEEGFVDGSAEDGAGTAVETEDALAPRASPAGAEGKATLVADAMTCPPEFEDGRMNWPNMTLQQCVDYCASTPSPCSFFTLAGNASCTVFKACPDLVAVESSELPAQTFEANATAMQSMEIAPVPLGKTSVENTSGNSTRVDSLQNNSGLAPLNDSTLSASSTDLDEGVTEAPSNISDSTTSDSSTALDAGVTEAPSNTSVPQPLSNTSEANPSTVSEANLSNDTALPSESIADKGGESAGGVTQNGTLEAPTKNASATDAAPLDPDDLFWNTTTPMPVGVAPASDALEPAGNGTANGTMVTHGFFPTLPSSNTTVPSSNTTVPSNASMVEPDGAEAEATEEMLRPRYSYRRHDGQYLYGFADGYASPLSEQKAQAKCDELGRGCGGFTCLTTVAETICTVRAGGFPLPSEAGETSYLQLCPTPADSASMGDYRDCLMEKCQDADPSFLATDAESITLATPSCQELSADCDAALFDGALVKHLCPMICSACEAPAEGYRLGPETIPPLGSDNAQAPEVIAPYEAGDAPLAEPAPPQDEEGNSTTEFIGNVVPWGNKSNSSLPGNNTLSPSASGGPVEAINESQWNAENISSANISSGVSAEAVNESQWNAENISSANISSGVSAEVVNESQWTEVNISAANASVPANDPTPANASGANVTRSEDPCEIDTKIECSNSMIPFVSVSCPEDKGSMSCDEEGGTCFCESGCWVGGRCEPRRSGTDNRTAARSLLITHSAMPRLPSLHESF